MGFVLYLQNKAFINRKLYRVKGNMKFHAKDAKRAIVNVLSFRRGKREEDIPH
jgi:hypothetical protein